MDDSGSQIAPVAAGTRIVALDVLWGFAVLGILLMNIQGFSMIQAAYFNPTAYGDLTGVHKWAWIVVHVLADQKFMTIFSWLFGAGVVIFSGRIADKDLRPGLYFYRCMFWLFVAGLIHAYLFWYGDILVLYAICGVPAYWVRKWRPRGLITLGLVLLAVPAFNYWLFGMSMEQWPEEALESISEVWNPPPAQIREEVEAMRGSFMDQMEVRVPAAYRMQTFMLLSWYGWRATGLMMIGMALLKLDILTAQRSYRFYSAWMLLGFAIGLPLVIAGIGHNFSADWDVRYSMFLGWEWNYAGSLFVGFAYVCTIMILVKLGFFRRVLDVVSRVGRMVFSIYILMTLLCTFIFYGHGLGYFGKVDRLGQMGIVVLVWAIVIPTAVLWMRNHRFGPLEWLWRMGACGRHIAATAEGKTDVQ